MLNLNSRNLKYIKLQVPNLKKASVYENYSNLYTIKSFKKLETYQPTLFPFASCMIL